MTRAIQHNLAREPTSDVILSLPDEIMSSLFASWSTFTALNALHIIGIVILALVLLRLLRVFTRSLVRHADSQSRNAKQREEHTRAVAAVIYSAGSAVIWFIAGTTALPEVGISPLPAMVFCGIAVLALGFGTQSLVRDFLGGVWIVLEDQFVTGDTLRIGEITGRVGSLTLRRTLVRDSSGALVTIANSELRTVSNLSRDWSQSFVDISVPPGGSMQRALEVLEGAASELRGDPSWSQALIDGPRILGIQSSDPLTLRLQVRTVPTRQDEVCRELRRRIQLQLHGQPILSPGPYDESSSTPASLAEIPDRRR
jgi:moderate conductance mechanosensitive channel